MTYCLAIRVNQGLVFASDSRTNAGIDHVSSYSKMHTFVHPGERVFVLLSAGNLATTQGVVRRLKEEFANWDPISLSAVSSLMAGADLVGRVSAEFQRHQLDRKIDRNSDQTSFDATFILGGQIAGQEPEMYLVYPQGNFIQESPSAPFLQIGETKYGKPILDRIIKPDTPLELAARCALVSLNSTIRSNLTVGPPVELMLYPRNGLNEERRMLLTEDSPYYRALGESWSEGLNRALNSLPRFSWETDTKDHVSAL
jgi:putative proteasome-type protease